MFFLRVEAFALILLACASAAHAQPLPRAVVEQRARNPEHLFNWYYASVYGTGYYKVGEEEVAVLRVPLSYTLRKPSDEQWGVRLTLPVSTALAQFDLSEFDFGKLRTTGLTIMPGVEVEIPITRDWSVKPFVNVGGGWEFRSDASAAIYAVGATTAWRAPVGRDMTGTLGGKLVYAGYAAGSEKSMLAALSLGGELARPVDVEVSGRRLYGGAQLAGTVYFNDLEFLMPGSGVREVSKEGEIGLTLGVRKPFEILGVGFDRVGLSYVRGSGGLRGVRLLGSFPF